MMLLNVHHQIKGGYMKRKTMNSVIQKKINDWLNHIDDEKVVQQLRDNIIVTGGCITSMILNEDINDFDVYFKNKKTTKMVAEYYAKKFNENNKGRTNNIGHELKAWVLDGSDLESWKDNQKKLSSFAFGYPDFTYSEVNTWEYDEKDEDRHRMASVSGMLTNTDEGRIKIMINSDGIAEDSDSIADKAEYDIDLYLDALSDGDIIPAEVLEEEKKYKPVFLSTNAITLSNQVQLITRFYGEAEEIHSNYDFVHTTNYWDSKTGKVELNIKALESIMNKDLFYVGSKYPIASLIRTRKFIKRGWKITAGEYVKMAFQINELDLTNINVLEDQLVGVDSIYFLSFISNLRKKKTGDKNFVVTRDYVTTVIDKVFG
jgi:hypothetical protein